MKLLSYSYQNQSRWGVVQDDGVVDSQQMRLNLATTLIGFVAQCETDPALANRVQSRAADLPRTPVSAVQIEPCIAHPGKIICLGVNYVDHAKEGGNSVGGYPTLFFRCDTSLLAHGSPLRVPRISSKMDFEAELALVIGQRMRHVPFEAALAHVFGYACFNDVTLRDYQKRTSQWTIGKNFDATGGFGPYLVTADALPPGCIGLHIESRLNGQVMQSANTSDMVFGVAQTLSLLSDAMTLEPGDVVVMGTPAGVGYARTPPVWMKAGDTIEVEIEGVGILSNPVTD